MSASPESCAQSLRALPQNAGGHEQRRCACGGADMMVPCSPYALDSACSGAPANSASPGCCTASGGEGGAARQTSLVRPSPAFQTRRAERQSSPAGFSASSRGWSMAAGIWNQPAQHRRSQHHITGCAASGSCAAPRHSRGGALPLPAYPALRQLQRTIISAGMWRLPALNAQVDRLLDHRCSPDSAPAHIS